MSNKSTYEEAFEVWLDIAKENNFVSKWDREPTKFFVSEKVNYEFIKTLKTTEKAVEKTIIDEIPYTPDYRVKFTTHFFNEFPNAKHDLLLVEDNLGYCWFDVKSKFQGKTTASNRTLRHNQYLMLKKYNIFVTRLTLDKTYNLYYYTFAPFPFCLDKRPHKKNTVKTAFRKAKSFLSNRGFIQKQSLKF